MVVPEGERMPKFAIVGTIEVAPGQRDRSYFANGAQSPCRKDDVTKKEVIGSISSL
jgi:hypothetical protein